jgi:hypothetical protein
MPSARLSALALAGVVGTAPPLARAAEPQPDRLTLAQGKIALPVEAEASVKVRDELAVRRIDGSPAGFVLTTAVARETTTASVQQVAAPTVFERLAVRGMRETPSLSQSLARTAETFGSAIYGRAGFERIGSATLSTHRSRGLEIDPLLHPHAPVRWLRVRLSGALVPARPNMSLACSEPVGPGRQQEAPRLTRFGGPWTGCGWRCRCAERPGIGVGRLRATGVGEARPLASNDDEIGRSLNRRVEIHSGGRCVGRLRRAARRRGRDGARRCRPASRDPVRRPRRGARPAPRGIEVRLRPLGGIGPRP